MGHTYREIFPKEATRHNRMINRILALRHKLKHVSLSEFTPDDLPTLFRIMDNRSSDPTEKELDQIEQKLDDLMSAP